MGVLVVGAHAKLYINGSAFGRVADYGFTESTPQKEVHGIDYLPPWELVPQGVSISCNMTIYRRQQDGGLEGAGLKATWPDHPMAKYFSVLLTERSSDTVLFRADRCSVESQSWHFAPKSYVMGQVSFRCLLWSNETQSTSG